MAGQDPKARARARYLAGGDLRSLADELGLEQDQLIRWAAEGGWAAMRRAWLADPRGASAALRELMAKKVEDLVASGELGARQADELAKIASACARLEREGYDLKAAAVEVGERLAALAAEGAGDPERLAWLGRLLAKLFNRLDSEGAA
ncbi:MAG: hypothetical protein K9K66_17615 [Desulfarculaceae bacterium]|nr:hypothetical protein [Desulfarculaceae bacterium]MCF8072576.1 hypothetical protein [Desulfarculaceae bacterium]MCF8103479.1 hypothetical protein [Desulfarculaceae bacterium]MCF8117503.1 hypothetical protein [Desulfarculaceae bacterium]